MNEYWLYLDDSGKFTNINDKHVIYGGLLFNSKEKRDYFIKCFQQKRKLITKKNELKGNDIVKLYEKHKKNIQKRGNIGLYLSQLKYTDAVFCVFTCTNELYESAKDEEHAKLKRNQMISALLQFLVKKKKIKNNSYINIYLDELENEEKWSKDEIKLKEYLNCNHSINRMIAFLRTQNIWIKEIKHLNSIKDCIQGADIIANFSNKYLNSYNEIYKFLDLLKNHEVKILNCKFPKIVYNNYISNYKCNCCQPESSR